MERYQVGDIMPLREKGEQFANVRIVRKFSNDDGEQMVESEVIELAQTYRGNLKLGAKITFPEDGYVGTFDNPNAEGDDEAV